MSDEGQLFRVVDWRRALPFTHLFRAFRIAIHPSKLLLGLALLVTVFVGGSALDLFWPSKDRAVVDEATLYQLAPSSSDFNDAVRIAGDAREGVFVDFFHYEAHEFSEVVDSVLAAQWIKSLDQPGVSGHIYNFIAVGPLWLVRTHTVFAILFTIIFLAAWSLFGGAISRLTAVHVARDEKISIRQALDFALHKFLSFFSAPVIPVLIVVAVGLVLAVASLLANIPFIGPAILGAAFGLALVAGFVMTLVILGALGGFNLMYPTIAVEGSDSFDAISRSFSYIYARPWRLLFYTAVSVAYGAITYLFVRSFILMTLVLAHHFVSMGVFVHDAQGTPLFPTMWPSPAATGHLTYWTDFAQLNWGENIGARMLGFWIYLVIGILGSFAITFYFSANTIIYFLIRRELDSTEMDEVYLDQIDEDFGNPLAGSDVADVEATVTVARETIVTETIVQTESPVSARRRPIQTTWVHNVIKIAMIGAGSVVFAKNLACDILSYPEFREATISLMDIDGRRLEVAKNLLAKVARASNATPRIEATQDRRLALAGADFVINMFQIGGLESTRIDFEIPRKFGLNFTIADTTGPGGIFRALRTYPVLRELCRDIADVCPRAWLLNYSNPMSMNMRTIAAAGCERTVGLCHSVQGTINQLAWYLQIDPKEIVFTCAGINHMAFYLKLEKDGHDLYPRIHELAYRHDIYITNKVRFELLKKLGYYVTESSEHNAEYCPYFIPHGPETIAQYNIPIDEYLRRCDQYTRDFAELEKDAFSDQPTHLNRTQEYAAPIIRSIVTGQPTVIYGNMPNRGAIADLPADAIAETSALVDRSGIRLTTVGHFPPQLLGYIQPHLIQQELFIRAATQGRRDHVYQAAMFDPLTAATLTLDQIVQMCDELIAAHGTMLPNLK